MNWNAVYTAIFSPSGTTRTVTEGVAKAFAGERREDDLLARPLSAPFNLPEGSVFIVGAPVFAGRLPAVFTQRLKQYHGHGTPAVAVVAYGNREYEDALLELSDLLEELGFVVAGAGAFVAQHSIFPTVAKGRPDNGDKEKIAAFGAACAQAVAALQPGEAKALPIKGNRPYRQASGGPLHPVASKNCIRCGACASICPVGAISMKNPMETDKETCISCTACIAACPVNARAFRGPIYATAKKGFERKCSARKEPEWFV